MKKIFLCSVTALVCGFLIADALADASRSAPDPGVRGEAKTTLANAPRVVSPFEAPESEPYDEANVSRISPAGVLGATLTVPVPYATIQSAIDAAATSGDSIVVSAGT
jgi:hypothetical protein